jgi:hypothetical protein
MGLPIRNLCVLVCHKYNLPNQIIRKFGIAIEVSRTFWSEVDKFKNCVGCDIHDVSGPALL